MTALEDLDWDDGSLAEAATAGLPDGPAGSWLALPPGGPVRMLIPRDHAAAGTPAVQQLMGHTSALRRVAATAAARALALGGDRLLPARPRWDAAANRLLAHARAVASLPDAVGVIRLNPDRPTRKPVVQLLARDLTTTLGYVKIGWDSLTAPAIRRETATLRALQPPASLLVPTILGADTGEVPVLAVAPVIHDGAARRVGTPTDLALASLRVFGREGFGFDGRAALRDTAPVAETRRELEETADLPYAATLLRRLDTLLERHGDVEVATGRWHGDWNRANVVLGTDSVGAWDWERSTTGAPHGLDAAYTLLNEESAATSRRVLHDLAVEPATVAGLLGLAAIVAATRHVEAILLRVPTQSGKAMRVVDDALTAR